MVYSPQIQQYSCGNYEQQHKVEGCHSWPPFVTKQLTQNQFSDN